MQKESEEMKLEQAAQAADGTAVERAPAEVQKKKLGRPAGVSITDYNKDIINQSNARYRNTKGQELFKKLAELFYSVYKEHCGILFWMPLQNEQASNFSLSSLLEGAALKSYVEGNVYRLVDIKHTRGACRGYSEKDLGGSLLSSTLVFERINYPDGCFRPPRVSCGTVDFIRRIFSNRPEDAAAFLDPEVHKQYVSAAMEAAQEYSDIGEIRGPILSNCSWILKDLAENPGRYRYDRNNWNYLFYKRKSVEMTVLEYKSRLSTLKHDFAEMADPGTFGFENRAAAEENFAGRLRAIYAFVNQKAYERRLTRWGSALAEWKTAKKSKRLAAARAIKKGIEELGRDGVVVTEKDFDVLPPGKKAELDWLKGNYTRLRKYNHTEKQIAGAESLLEKAVTAVAKLNSSIQKAERGSFKLHKDGLDEIYAYWRAAVSSAKKRKETQSAAPEDENAPLSAKNAASLLAGGIKAGMEAQAGFIPPVFRQDKQEEPRQEPEV